MPEMFTDSRGELFCFHLFVPLHGGTHDLDGVVARGGRFDRSFRELVQEKKIINALEADGGLDPLNNYHGEEREWEADDGEQRQRGERFRGRDGNA